MSLYYLSMLNSFGMQAAFLIILGICLLLMLNWFVKRGMLKESVRKFLTIVSLTPFVMILILILRMVLFPFIGYDLLLSRVYAKIRLARLGSENFLTKLEKGEGNESVCIENIKSQKYKKQ